MSQRQVKFKDKMLNLVGPQLKPGDAAPDFACVTGLDVVKLGDTPKTARLFSVVPSPAPAWPLLPNQSSPRLARTIAPIPIPAPPAAKVPV